MRIIGFTKCQSIVYIRRYTYVMYLYISGREWNPGLYPNTCKMLEYNTVTISKQNSERNNYAYIKYSPR